MRIAGFLENSLIDYPGKVASVIFTAGCNLRCQFCHNPELIPKFSLGRKHITEDIVFNYFIKNDKWLDALVLLGGEPTVQKDLPQFCDMFKRLFPNKLIKLDTNGTNPEMVKELLNKRLVDYVAMDIKVNLLNNSQYQLTRDIIINKAPAYEFRLTCVPTIVTDANIELILGYFNTSAKIYLQSFRNEKTLDKSLKKVQPYTLSKLQEWVNKYKVTFPHLEVRG